MNHILQHMQPLLHEYGLWVVFVNLLLETFGLPLPGESLLIAAATLAAKGTVNIWMLLLTAWAAAVVGDNAAFYVGRIGGRRLLLRFGSKLGITRRRIRQMERFYKRFGPEVVIVARFVAVARQLNGLVAGSSGMAPGRFFAYNVIGAALWVGAWGLGAYYLGNSMRALLNRGAHVLIWVLVIGTLSSSFFLLYRFWSRRSR